MHEDLYGILEVQFPADLMMAWKIGFSSTSRSRQLPAALDRRAWYPVYLDEMHKNCR
jgi:hypothetical protein